MSEICLIIPAYNEGKFVGDCLESVQKYAPQLKEVVVVDNASTDDTADVVARYPGVRLVREPVKGLTRARQTGLDATSAPYVAYIDADCRLTPQWYARADHYLSTNPDAAVLSGPIKYYDGPLLLKWFVVAIQWMLLPVTFLTARNWVLGGNFVAKRTALEAIGGFDASIAFYGEDADVGRRLISQGRSLFKMDFYCYTSARRMVKEGVIRTYARYTLNFIWHIFFKKSFTEAYTDARH